MFPVCESTLDLGKGLIIMKGYTNSIVVLFACVLHFNFSQHIWWQIWKHRGKYSGKWTWWTWGEAKLYTGSSLQMESSRAAGRLWSQAVDRGCQSVEINSQLSGFHWQVHHVQKMDSFMNPQYLQ